MKNFFLLLFTFISGFIYSQTESIIDYKSFKSPHGNFIETYVSILSSSIKYVPNDLGIDRCRIEVLQMIKKEDKIIDFEKIVLQNNGNTSKDLYNDLLHQNRFLVENGIYDYEVEIRDLNIDSASPILYKQKIEVNYSDDAIEISDIELLDAFWKDQQESIKSKSGYAMTPMISYFFSPEFEKIAYYFEVYNTDKVLGQDGKYVLQHFIESYEKGIIAGSLNKISKEKANSINPTLNVFDINALPTGNYNLVIQVKNHENKVVKEKKIRFQRLNLLNDMNPNNLKDVSLGGKFTDRLHRDSLDEFIYCLRPISTPIEAKIIDNQLKDMTDTLKLQYIYSFWYNRNIEDPESAWNTYKNEVKNVNVMFGTKVKEGYETDRGRIFLKYGAPNTVHDQKQEANSYPYQIWHYYKIGKFNDKRFVFYDKDLVTNDYELLHSDLIGEIQNYHWKIDLKKRNTPGGNIDATDPSSQYGERTNDLFDQP